MRGCIWYFARTNIIRLSSNYSAAFVGNFESLLTTVLEPSFHTVKQYVKHCNNNALYILTRVCWGANGFALLNSAIFFDFVPLCAFFNLTDRQE